MNWKLLLFSWSPSTVRGSGANGAVILITKMSKNFSGQISDESSLGWQNLPELWFSTILGIWIVFFFVILLWTWLCFRNTQCSPSSPRCRYSSPTNYIVKFLFTCMSISWLHDPPWQVGILFTIMVAGLSTKLETKHSMENHC